MTNAARVAEPNLLHAVEALTRSVNSGNLDARLNPADAPDDGLVDAINGLVHALVQPSQRALEGLEKLAGGQLDTDDNADYPYEAIIARSLGDVAERMHWYQSMLDSIPFPISVTDSGLSASA